MGAKYQKGLDKTKEFLKSHSALTIREVCDKAEIEAKDADILINRFNKRRGRLHVYKTDPKNMAHAFAEAFFSAEDGVAITEAVEISPYPKQNKKEINKNDD